MEKHVTKIYVNSPVFGPEDEEVYKYVDPDIDNSEALRLDSEDTLLQIQTRDGDRESEDSTESERYEDMGKHYAEGHSSRSKFKHQQSTQVVQQKQPFNPSTANRKYEELNDEEEEERLEVERRNRSQRRQMEQNHIPQLDLIDSDDEKLMHQGFTDLEIDEGRNSDAYKKTAEMVWMANQKNLLAKGGAEAPDLNPTAKMEKVPRPYNREPDSRRSFPADERSTRYQHPLSQVANESSYNPQNESKIEKVPRPYNYESDSRRSFPADERSTGYHHPLSQVANEGSYNPQNESHLLGARSSFPPPPLVSQILPHDVVRGFQPFQPYTIENSLPLAENNFSSQNPMEPAWASMDHHGMRYQQRRYNSDSNLIKILPTAGGANKSKDFIKANRKEVVKKERPKKMYGDMFSKRKKKENVETGPLLRRHSEEVQIREPAPTNRSQNMSGSVLQQPFPVTIYQQPVAAASHHPPQLFPSHIMPMQSMAYSSVHPLEHQQRVSIPLQFQGVSGLEQQNVSVDINLRLVSPDPQFPPQPSTARKPVQQPNLTGHYPAYNPGTSTAVGLPMSDSQAMLSYGVLPPLTMNSYMVLPPVGDSVMNQQHAETERLPPAERSIKTPPKGGYAELQKKQNQPPQYKEYTIGDYRRLKKEIKTLNLGKLGPDLDTQERIQKMVKEKRKQQYSKQVKQRNRLELASKSHRESAPDSHLQQGDATDRRTIALEYAKTVPKPRVVRRESDNHLTIYEHNRKAEHESLPDELEELQLLKERHNLERKQLELIEMGVKTILAQNA